MAQQFPAASTLKIYQRSGAVFQSNYKTPVAGMQRGIVIDNKDPKSQGRVRVQFDWQARVNEPTGWLRVMAPGCGKK